MPILINMKTLTWTNRIHTEILKNLCAVSRESHDVVEELFVQPGSLVLAARAEKLLGDVLEAEVDARTLGYSDFAEGASRAARALRMALQLHSAAQSL